MLELKITILSTTTTYVLIYACSLSSTTDELWPWTGLLSSRGLQLLQTGEQQDRNSSKLLETVGDRFLGNIKAK
jgi:hypothetical protein